MGNSSSSFTVVLHCLHVSSRKGVLAVSKTQCPLDGVHFPQILIHWPESVNHFPIRWGLLSLHHKPEHFGCGVSPGVAVRLFCELLSSRHVVTPLD